ncbi:GNAT family N-acetyltransferase [Stappia sp.]|uniref:GNAT family N-acetyltransferase n=1 Tax=Stappia sp. TaxID=1870903 RepID=UPI0032D8BC9D
MTGTLRAASAVADTHCAIEPACEADLPACVALLAAHAVGTRVGAEAPDLAPYLAVFRRMAASDRVTLYVARLPGMEPGEIAGMFELTVLRGLSFAGRPRAQVESVHVEARCQRRGVGQAMMAFAEQRARDLGCVLVQLTSNRERAGAHAFYAALGYDSSHLGFKKML